MSAKYLVTMDLSLYAADQKLTVSELGLLLWAFYLDDNRFTLAECQERFGADVAEHLDFLATRQYLVFDGERYTLVKSEGKQLGALAATFEEFRKKYPGVKHGHETMFKAFKKHKDWKVVLPTLLPALEVMLPHYESLKLEGKPQMIPHLLTWLNQRRWETVEVHQSNETGISRSKYEQWLDNQPFAPMIKARNAQLTETQFGCWFNKQAPFNGLSKKFSDQSIRGLFVSAHSSWFANSQKYPNVYEYLVSLTR